jgi:hypothetical protein
VQSISSRLLDIIRHATGDQREQSEVVEAMHRRTQQNTTHNGAKTIFVFVNLRVKRKLDSALAQRCAEQARYYQRAPFCLHTRMSSLSKTKSMSRVRRRERS